MLRLPGASFCSRAPLFGAALVLLVGTAPYLPAGAAVTTRSAAHRTPRYVLVDLGTFGGPTSFFDCCGNIPSVLNDGGVAAGEAQTSVANPYASNPNFNCDSTIDPFDEGFAFKWQSGVLENLGALPGGFNSYALSINPNGAVVGTSENGQTDPLLALASCVAVLWKAGGIVDLGTLGGGYESIAFTLNDNVQVAGASANTISDAYSFFGWNTQSRAFVWQRGAMRDLGTLGTGNDASASYINARGQITGFSYTNAVANSGTSYPTQDPFFWDGGKMVDVGTLGGTSGFPNDLNERGQVVGQSNLAGDAANHPFLWSRSRGLKDLGTLGGANGFAMQLNDAGAVVGRADITQGTSVHHAFLWEHGSMLDLGLPPGGGPCSTAYAINQRGQIIGDAGACNVGGTPFLWENGTNYDLNSLILPGSDLTVSDVDEINDRGEIACYGALANGATHACLLVPLELARREGLTRLVGAGSDFSSRNSIGTLRRPTGGFVRRPMPAVFGRQHTGA